MCVCCLACGVVINASIIIQFINVILIILVSVKQVQTTGLQRKRPRKRTSINRYQGGDMSTCTQDFSNGIGFRFWGRVTLPPSRIPLNTGESENRGVEWRYWGQDLVR